MGRLRETREKGRNYADFKFIDQACIGQLQYEMPVLFLCG